MPSGVGKIKVADITRADTSHIKAVLSIPLVGNADWPAVGRRVRQLLNPLFTALEVQKAGKPRGHRLAPYVVDVL